MSLSTTQGGGGRILAAASRHRKELSSPRRSRQRGYRALFYAPGLVGLQAGAVVLSPGGHLDSAVSFSAAAVGVLRLEKKNGPLVVSLSRAEVSHARERLLLWLLLLDDDWKMRSEKRIMP